MACVNEHHIAVASCISRAATKLIFDAAAACEIRSDLKPCIDAYSNVREDVEALGELCVFRSILRLPGRYKVIVKPL